MTRRKTAENPWVDLPDKAPYVLPGDLESVTAFNLRAAARTRIETALMPEPWVGRTDAPVLLLTLNPGASPGDFAVHQQASFRETVRRCHRQDAVQYPNYYLDPDISGPGARWLNRIARPLIQQCGAKRVSQGLALIELFPYHSAGFAHGSMLLSSRAYTLELVRRAMVSGAAIFITRGRQLWLEAVPELERYARLFTTRSVQNVTISPKNAPEGFAVAAAAICALGA